MTSKITRCIIHAPANGPQYVISGGSVEDGNAMFYRDGYHLEDMLICPLGMFSPQQIKRAAEKYRAAIAASLHAAEPPALPSLGGIAVDVLLEDTSNFPPRPRIIGIPLANGHQVQNVSRAPVRLIKLPALFNAKLHPSPCIHAIWQRCAGDRFPPAIRDELDARRRRGCHDMTASGK